MLLKDLRIKYEGWNQTLGLTVVRQLVGKGQNPLATAKCLLQPDV